MSEGRSGAHGIQGIGAGFVPKVLNTEIYDEVMTVENEEAFVFGKEIAKTEGILVGISSGAAMSAAVKLAKRPENNGKTIVVCFLTAEIAIIRHHCFNKGRNNKSEDLLQIFLDLYKKPLICLSNLFWILKNVSVLQVCLSVK